MFGEPGEGNAIDDLLDTAGEGIKLPNSCCKEGGSGGEKDWIGDSENEAVESLKRAEERRECRAIDWRGEVSGLCDRLSLRSGEVMRRRGELSAGDGRMLLWEESSLCCGSEKGTSLNSSFTNLAVARKDGGGISLPIRAITEEEEKMEEEEEEGRKRDA